MALESYCAACTYLGERCDSYGKYWCERKGEDHYACDPKCYNFTEAYSRSTSARENMYENSRSHSSGGGCYITTAMCDILGYKDNCYHLQILREFRDNVLKKNRKYWSLLIAYDIIGPTISTNLKNETCKLSIAKVLFEQYISKAVTAIENKDTETAIAVYTDMTQKLANLYGIDANTIIIDAQNMKVKDTSTLGHARKKTLNQF